MGYLARLLSAAIKKFTAPPVTGGDPYWASVVMLAANDSKPNGTTVFTDQSTFAHPIGSQGGAAYSSALAPVGLTSSYLGNGASYLSAPSADLALGAGDFTVECFAYVAAGAPVSVMGTGAAVAQWYLFLQTSAGWQFYINGSLIFTTSGTFGAGAWHHLAVVRQGTAVRGYYDGVLVGSGVNGSVLSGTSFGMGARDNAGTNPLTGNLASIRVTKGVSRYNNNFVPPVLPLPTTQGQVRTYATWNPADKSGSMTLSNGNLTAASSATPSGVRATIGVSADSWYWETTVAGVDPNEAIFVGIANSTAVFTQFPDSNPNYWTYYGNSGNKQNGNSVAYGAPFGVGDVIGFAFNATAHTLEFFKNNVSQGVAFTGIPAGTYYPVFCTGNANEHSITTNFGQYPFKYTPPTGYNPGVSVPTARLGVNLQIANDEPPPGTVTILDQSRYAGINNAQVIGAAQFTAVQHPLGLATSLLFDGASRVDYTFDNNLPGLAFGNNDFTIEGYAYSAAVNGALMGSGDGAGEWFIYNNNTAWQFYIGGALVAGAAQRLSTSWNHFAVTRESGVLRLFTNGIMQFEGTDNTDLNGQSLTVGDATVFGGRPFTGFVAPIRFTNGVARYTANFAAPAPQLPLPPP